MLGLKSKPDEEDISLEEEKKLEKLIFQAPEDLKNKNEKEEYYDLLKNANSTLPLMNLSEIYQKQKDGKK